MITIAADIREDGTVFPAEPIPEDALLATFDGQAWRVYMPGDTLPGNEDA